MRPKPFVHKYRDDYHPVSGNRQFGLKTNADGTYTFYTKGADRATSIFDAIISPGIYYGGSLLWAAVMQNIQNFVGASNSNINDPIVNRPWWSEIQNLLESNTPINYVPCQE